MNKSLREKSKIVAKTKWVNLTGLIRQFLIEEVKKHEKENWDIDQFKLFSN